MGTFCRSLSWFFARLKQNPKNDDETENAESEMADKENKNEK